MTHETTTRRDEIMTSTHDFTHGGGRASLGEGQLSRCATTRALRDSNPQPSDPKSPSIEGGCPTGRSDSASLRDESPTLSPTVPHTPIFIWPSTSPTHIGRGRPTRGTLDRSGTKVAAASGAGRCPNYSVLLNSCLAALLLAACGGPNEHEQALARRRAMECDGVGGVLEFMKRAEQYDTWCVRFVDLAADTAPTAAERVP